MANNRLIRIAVGIGLLVLIGVGILYALPFLLLGVASNMVNLVVMLVGLAALIYLIVLIFRKFFLNV